MNSGSIVVLIVVSIIWFGLAFVIVYRMVKGSGMTITKDMEDDEKRVDKVIKRFNNMQNNSDDKE